MAKVTLSTIMFNSRADLSDYLILFSASKLTRADSVEGYFADSDVRTTWVQTRQVVKYAWTVECNLATPAQRVWLRAHIGHPGVWVRDHLGKRISGVFAEVSDTPYPGADLSPVQIVIGEISDSIEV